MAPSRRAARRWDRWRTSTCAWAAGGAVLARALPSVAALYHALPESKRAASVAWWGKRGVMFSDALSAVRRWLWAEAGLPQAGDDGAWYNSPRASGVAARLARTRRLTLKERHQSSFGT